MTLWHKPMYGSFDMVQVSEEPRDCQDLHDEHEFKVDQDDPIVGDMEDKESGFDDSDPIEEEGIDIFIELGFDTEIEDYDPYTRIDIVEDELN